MIRKDCKNSDLSGGIQLVFRKGESGNPNGRPKGKRDLDTKKVQAVVNARAQTMLEGLLQKTHDVIDEALDDGNVQVAMWAYDKLIGKTASMLPQALDIKLSTIDDVLIAAQGVTEMVMQRKLSIDDGSKALNMLSQYSSFRAFERIDELKEIVDDMKRATEAKTINSQAVTPSWGRLSEDSKTANTKPAE